MPRTKQVEIDGAVFYISPLTYKQVEDWAATREELGDITLANAKSIRDNAFERVICASLNNAKRKGEFLNEGEWIPERVYNEMDRGLYDFLFNQIMTYMGFATTKGADSNEPIKAAKPGEPVAAS